MPVFSLTRALAAAAGVCLAAAGTVAIVPPTAATAAIVDPVIEYDGTGAASLTPIGTIQTPVFDEGAAEVVAYHAATQQLFVVNADAGVVEAIDISDPTAPVKVGEIDSEGVVDAESTTIPAGAVANSVAVRADRLVAVALENPDKVQNGWMLLADASDLSTLGAVRVGALPDMVAISPDGSTALTANEGEPNDAYSIDPVGSISVVALPAGLAAPAQSDVSTAGFGEWEAGGSETLADGVRIFAGIAADDQPVSRGLEPEYITVSPGSTTAWVSLQENNALAVVDLASATVTDILPLGTIDRSVIPMTMSNEAADLLARYTVDDLYGFFMPDTITSYQAGGQTLIVSANEGDAREWGEEGPNEYLEPERVEDLAAGGLLCDNFDAAEIATMGRLNVSIANGFNDTAGCYDELYSFGTRSFSIWSTTGERIYDSGELLEQITAAAIPDHFNSSNDNNTLGNRNDDKGPEPEAIAVGTIGATSFAFVGLERVGGIAVFDVTNPGAVSFTTYVNNRDFTLDVETALTTVGDSGPESIVFLSAAESPTGEPMVAVGNEVTGTTTLWSVDVAVETEVDGELAATGIDTAWFIAAAAGLAGTGALLLVLRVRRREAGLTASV